MKISCEYCGTQFETEVAHICPNCGASFDKNRIVEEKRTAENTKSRIEMERKRVELENRKIETERNRNTLHFMQQGIEVAKAVKIGCAIPIICFVLIIIVGTVMGIVEVVSQNDSNNPSSSYEDYDNTPEVIETPVTVNFNEVGETSKYAVMCDSYEIIDRYPFEPTMGYEYVTFHLIVENKSDERLETEQAIDCLADGIMCEERWDNNRLSLPGYINKGIKGAGYICFEVPINTVCFDIKYGDYITIHIDNTLHI